MMNSLVPQRTQSYLRIRNFRSQNSDKLSPGSIFQIFQMEIMQTEKNVHFKVKRDYCNEISIQKKCINYVF